MSAHRLGAVALAFALDGDDLRVLKYQPEKKGTADGGSDPPWVTELGLNWGISSVPLLAGRGNTMTRLSDKCIYATKKIGHLWHLTYRDNFNCGSVVIVQRFPPGGLLY
jgi:hypothetical protein